MIPKEMRSIGQVLIDINKHIDFSDCNFVGISGGSVSDIFHLNKVKDYDVYSDNPENLISKINSKNIAYETENTIGLNLPEIGLVEIIKIPFPTPKAVIDYHDFICVKAIVYKQKDTDKLNYLAHDEFYDHNCDMILKVESDRLKFLTGEHTLPLNDNQQKQPYKLYERLFKYSKKGFHVDGHLMFLIANALTRCRADVLQICTKESGYSNDSEERING